MPPFSLKTRITTPLLDETVAWYRDLLGLEVAEQWDEPDDKGCVLVLPGPAREALLEIYLGPATAGFADVSLQFQVDDVDAFRPPAEHRFASRGPVDRPWGSRYLFFTDPNGMLVVLFSGRSL